MATWTRGFISHRSWRLVAPTLSRVLCAQPSRGPGPGAARGPQLGAAAEAGAQAVEDEESTICGGSCR